jgi:hypothetical protein
LHLPDEIHVEVMRRDGTCAGLESLLVALDVRLGGRYYYGTLLGLTDATGTAATTGQQIERAFQADRQLFPMDYKVPLSACDSTVVVRIKGGPEFLEARSNGAARPQTAADAHEMWLAARNEHVASIAVEVQFAPEAAVVTVPLIVSCAGE